MEAATAGFDRTTAQRFDALSKANHVRTYRAHVKRDVKAGALSLAKLLTEPPELLETMKVIDLLMAAPHVGRVKAMKMLNRARVSPSKMVGGLSDRQRTELMSILSLR